MRRVGVVSCFRADFSAGTASGLAPEATSRLIRTLRPIASGRYPVGVGQVGAGQVGVESGRRRSGRRRIRLAPVRLAPVRLASVRLALVRSAWVRLAPDRLASVRLAPVRLASVRSAPVRSGAGQVGVAQVGACDIRLDQVYDSRPSRAPSDHCEGGLDVRGRLGRQRGGVGVLAPSRTNADSASSTG